MQKIKSKKFWIIKTALSIVVLIIIAKSVRIELTSVDFRYTAFILPVLLLSLLLRAWRWNYLIGLSTDKIRFSTALRLLFVGQALNTFMPGGAGDIAKSYFGYKWSGLKEEMFSASLVDKLIAVSSIFFLALISYFSKKEIIFLAASAIAFLPLSIILLSRSTLFRKMADKIFGRFAFINVNKTLELVSIPATAFFLALALSIPGWILTYSLLYFSFKSFHIPVDYTSVLLIMPVLPIVRLFPLTLNGLGSDEFAILHLFSTSGASNSAMFLAAIYFRIITLVVPAIIGVVIIWLSPNAIKSKSVSEITPNSGTGQC